MNLDIGLYQQQSMKLVMTQELRQAISLLQLSTHELTNYIEEAALENPLMEIERQELTMHTIHEAYKMPVMWHDEPPEMQEKEDHRDFSMFDQVRDDNIGISDYLIEQIRLMPLNELEMKQLMYLAGNVGDNGYLEGSYKEAAKVFSISPKQYEELVVTLQTLEPAGVAARSLQECLMLQLKRMSPRNELAEKVAAAGLEELGTYNWKKLATELNVSLKDIQRVHDDIQQLNPYPGSPFDSEEPAWLVPDVYIEKDGSEFCVRLHDDSLPKIRLNDQYRHLLESKEEGEATEYAQKKYKQLTWILNSINQRQQTIKNVTEAIVEFQYDFFKDGSNEMKPLTLKDVADKADVHESTVSRTTTNKYVQTPHGLFELKHFFSTGVNSLDGEQTSTLAIKKMIHDLVNQEEKQAPLSDQKISTQIESDKGISISRRAVAKYRDELNIPSSSKRKRYV
ncbi:RNA polymerase sigma-54 factor [Salibacterium salarium]|uniref:RNA polymerase factor sigma-54 n=1 Tax=Salibacterium salarium TaxID=284579 RepID=UPI00277E6B82|nr:RNA polymerase factor sigma-54 [Salibacterium salarium]MDQ0298309.1 RNA polymerase sigma-54 factor [Salibacterium salarium]